MIIYTEMKCIYFVVHLMLYASVLLYEGKANAQMLFLNKDDAREMCDSKEDKLLSYKDIENETMVNLLEERLDDEETIWIADYAEYSWFISYVGCYNDVPEFQNIKETVTAGSGLFSCLKRCTNSADNYYIGVRLTKCYCIRDSEYSNMRNFVTSDQYCDISREGLFHKKYTPNHGSIMIVYEILPQQHLGKISVGKNKSQCVYTRIGSSQIVDYITGTCSANFDAKGFVCTQSAYPCRKNNSCQTQTYSIQQTVKGILQTELTCQKQNRILHKIPIDLDAQNENLYLTGTFRVFELRQSSSVCLSVRKSRADSLVIEPGDCSVNKSSICHNDLYTVTTSDSKSQFPDELSTTDYIDSTTISNLDMNNDNNTTTVYIIIILSVVCIVVAVTICFFYRHFKVRNTAAKSITALTPETSAVNLLPNQTDNTSEHEYAIPSTNNKDDLEQVTIPKKPQRKALRKPAPDSSYENFVFGVASNKTEKCEHENNYDRINLKVIPKKNDENPYEGDSKIYNHTSNNTGDDYDTLNSAKKTRIKNEALEDYSTLNAVPRKSESNDTKCEEEKN